MEIELKKFCGSIAQRLYMRYTNTLIRVFFMEGPNILAVIVLYHPDEKQLLSLLKVCTESSNVHILLFDNAQIFNSLKRQIPCFINYFQSPENVGIGGAHYYACQMAVDKKFDFVLLLDQDSQLPDNFVDNMIVGFYQVQKYYPRLAAVGPSRSDPRLTLPKKNKWRSKLEKNVQLKALIDLWRLKTLLISSGMLIQVSALETIGFPKKEYFIDLVDTEWCLRAHAKTFQLARLEDVWMSHTIGNVKKVGRFNLNYQSPFRYYYTMRNSLLLFSEKQISFSFRMVILLRNLLEIRKLPFVPEPLASFSAVWRGLKEGVRQYVNKTIINGCRRPNRS